METKKKRPTTTKQKKKKKTATTKTQRERKREKAKHGIFRIKQLKSATGANETDADVFLFFFWSFKETFESVECKTST